MRRRTLIAATGTALAGCLGGSGGSTPAAPATTLRGPRQDDDLPPDGSPGDGYPPAFETTPAAREIDTGSFDTVSRNGVEVPLAPVEVAYYWYARGAARFADARGAGQYERSHVYGAVLSPAPEGGSDDPVADWPRDERIVCYCGCPHHLSSIRAANLIDAGYRSVYVIDEGFWEWRDRGYPVAGSDVEARRDPWMIDGTADPRYAGETAWARHPPSGQQEAAPIGDGGRFRLELRFAGVDGGSVIAVETPGYRVAAPLAELADGTVTRPSTPS